MQPPHAGAIAGPSILDLVAPTSRAKAVATPTPFGDLLDAPTAAPSANSASTSGAHLHQPLQRPANDERREAAQRAEEPHEPSADRPAADDSTAESIEHQEPADNSPDEEGPSDGHVSEQVAPSDVVAESLAALALVPANPLPARTPTTEVAAGSASDELPAGVALELPEELRPGALVVPYDTLPQPITESDDSDPSSEPTTIQVELTAEISGPELAAAAGDIAHGIGAPLANQADKRERFEERTTEKGAQSDLSLPGLAESEEDAMAGSIADSSTASDAIQPQEDAAALESPGLITTAEVGASAETKPTASPEILTAPPVDYAPSVEGGRRQRIPTTILGPATSTSVRQSTELTTDSVRLLQRVARAFAAAQERGSEVRLRLTPPELGAVRLEVRIEDGAMVAKVETETAAAKTAIVENLSALRERLAEQGVRIERFDVDLMSRQQSGGPDYQARDDAKPGLDRTTATAPVPPPESTSVTTHAGAETASTGSLNVIV